MGGEGDIEKGQALFKGKCASCHKVTNEPLTGPGLLGIADRWGSTDEMLVKWIQNPQAAAKTGDPYIAGVVETWLPRSGWMSAQDVSEEDVRNIMAYVQNPPDAPAGAADSGCVNVDFLPEEDTGDSTVWFVILLVLFLLIAMSASGVNRSLMNGLRKQEGDDPLEDISYLARLRNWAWKNRVFVSILGVFAVAFGVVKGYQALMGIRCTKVINQSNQSSSFTPFTYVRTKWTVATVTKEPTSQSMREFQVPMFA